MRRSESNLDEYTAAASSEDSTMETEEIVHHLAAASTIEDQADILHYLIGIVGLEYKFPIGQVKIARASKTLLSTYLYFFLPQSGEVVAIRELLKTLYDAAVAKKHWAIVRHAAGVLGRRVEELSKCVTDLVVNMNKVAVGTPGDKEILISEERLKPADLSRLIQESFNDPSTGMLAQVCNF